MSVDLLSWRRATFALYAEARAAADPAAGWTRWRRGRDAMFAGHPESPIEDGAGFTGLPYLPYAPSLRFVAPVRPARPARLEVPTSDGVVPLDRIGRLDLPVGSLDVWWIAVYGGGVFVPFADATNGHTSYGGGRYLIDTVKGADLGSDNFEQEVSLSLLENEGQLLERVSAALARIDQGTFGRCQECGRDISRERLDAVPYTPYCIQCAARWIKFEKYGVVTGYVGGGRKVKM